MLGSQTERRDWRAAPRPAVALLHCAPSNPGVLIPPADYPKAFEQLSGLEAPILFPMAEKEGFEPPVRLPVQLISSQSHSTTLALLPMGSRHQREAVCLCKAQSLTKKAAQSPEPLLSVKNKFFGISRRFPHRSGIGQSG